MAGNQHLNLYLPKRDTLYFLIVHDLLIHVAHQRFIDHFLVAFPSVRDVPRNPRGAIFTRGRPLRVVLPEVILDPQHREIYFLPIVSLTGGTYFDWVGVGRSASMLAL